MNSIALGYLIKNEREWLERLLPPMLGAFDGVVAIDTGSTDGTQDYLRAQGALVEDAPWEGSYSLGRNRLITLARGWGYRHVLMLDGDEAMHPDTVNALRHEVLNDEARGFPRYNFCGWPDIRWNTRAYPDPQWRLVPTQIPAWYEGKLHESLYVDGKVANVNVPVVDGHIYHYGWCKSPAAIWLRYENYRRLTEGLPPMTAEEAAEVKADFTNDFQPNQPVDFWHPLQPNATT